MPRCPALSPLLAAGILAAWAVAACTSEPFPERRRTTYGSFEEEVYKILERELELMDPLSKAPDRLEVLHRSTDHADDPGRYVKEALAQTVVEPVGDLQRGLRAVLESQATNELFDDGSMELIGEFVGNLFDRLLRETAQGEVNERVPEALAKLASAAGGSNPDALMHLLFRMASIDRVVVPVGGLDGSVALQEVDAALVPGMEELYRRKESGMRSLHDWLAAELQDLEADDEVDAEVDPLVRRIFEPVCDGLSGTRPADLEAGCAQEQNLDLKAACLCDLHALRLGAPAWTVLVDEQGGFEPGPGMEDGLAGVAPYANLPERTERRSTDAQSYGLAFSARTSQHVYSYVDLKQSLAGLGLDAQRRILDRGYLWDLAAALPALMGSRLGSGGYLPETNVLLDLVWALRTLQRYPRLPIFLKTLSEVTKDGEGARLFAELLASFGRAAALVRGVDVLTPRNEMFDDLVGENALRALEVGKPCGHPPDRPDPCSAGWLTCEPVQGDPEVRGRCVATAPAPAVLEELAEPGVWTAADGRLHVEEPLLRKLFRTMTTSSAQLAGMGETMAEMMRYSVQADPSPIASLSCDELTDGHLDELHELEFIERTRWDDPEGHPDPEGTGDRTDPTRSLNQKLMQLMYDTNRAGYDPTILTIADSTLLEIPNLATFYLDSAANNMDIDAEWLDGDPSKPDFLLEGVLNTSAETVMCEMSLHFSDEPADADDDPLTPQAEQVDLFILRNHDLDGNLLEDTGNPKCNLGFDARLHFGSMLVANKTAGVLDALRPLIELFSRYGMEPDDPPRNVRLPGGRTQLLADLFSTLHTHYSEHSRNAQTPYDAELGRPDFDRQHGTGFRRAERYAVGIVDDPGSNPDGAARRDLFSVFMRFGALLDRSTVCLVERDERGVCPAQREVNAADELVAFSAWLLDRDASDDPVVPRAERWAEWGTACQSVEGAGLVCGHSAGVMRGSRRAEAVYREQRPSRLQLLVEAFRLVDDQIAPRPGEGREQAPAKWERWEAWKRVDLLELLLGVDSEGRLANRGTVHFVRTVTGILADAVAESYETYEACDPWSGQTCAGVNADMDETYEDLKTFFGTAGLANTVQLLDEVRRDPTLRQWIDTLLALNVHTSDDPDQDAAGAVLELAADIVQTAVDDAEVVEVLRFVGRVLEADSWFAHRIVETLGRLDAADPDRVVAALLKNLTREDRRRARSRFALRTLKDLLADVSRDEPLQPGHYTKGDYRRVLERTRDFMRDEVHGFQRIVDVTKSRLPGQ